MVKEKPNSIRIYDKDGFRRRAACICVRSDAETEVSWLFFFYVSSKQMFLILVDNVIRLLFARISMPNLQFFIMTEPFIALLSEFWVIVCFQFV